MDAYDRTARLSVAYLVAFPLSFYAAMNVLESPEVWVKIATLVVGVGLPTLITDLVRDRGYKNQAELWRQWGGPPTTSALRWRTTINPVMQQVRHDHLQRVSNVTLPSAAEEANAPADADDKYEAAVSVARRLAASAGLVAKENIRYGFRRNLYGCRYFAVGAGSVSLVVSVTIWVLGFAQVSSALSIVTVTIAAAWIFAPIVITSEFVQKAAARYADALLSSLPELD